jgi:hypothetical protein
MPGRLGARDAPMARPWPKKSKWPYVAKNGRRSYVVGFYDHDRREQMLREGVAKGTRKQAWRVLSATLSWAASSNLVGEIQTNGCSFAPEPRGNIRRSLRSGGTGYEPGPRRHGPLVPAWALSPQAVEAIRAQMLARAVGREPILARRDAMIVSLQYGLCARNQEVWGCAAPPNAWRSCSSVGSGGVAQRSASWMLDTH